MAIPALREIVISDALGVNWNTINYTGNGTNNLVRLDNGTLYFIGISSGNDPFWFKSTNGGLTWSSSGSLHAVTATQISAWADIYTDPSGTLGTRIHFIYADSVSDDVFYYNLDTSTDTLSSRYTVFAGASTGPSCVMSITISRGGTIYVAGTIDDGTEKYTKKSTDGGANWSDIAAVYDAVSDLVYLAPGFAADDDDIMCIYYDADLTKLVRKVYDASGDSWSSSDIGTGITFPALGNYYSNMNLAVDVTNSQLLVVAWTGADTANADLKFWTVSESSITAKTDVVLNSVDDQVCCAVAIDLDTEDWYVFYFGSSDGVETVSSNLRIYYKVSTDDGATWGSETRIEALRADGKALFVTPHFKKFPTVCRLVSSTASFTSVSIALADVSYYNGSSWVPILGVTYLP